METNEENKIIVKICPSIFIKPFYSILNYQVYLLFCEKIKDEIEMTDNFCCKS